MKEYERRIKISDNRILIYSIIDGFAKSTYIINEGFLKGEELEKTLNLSEWDDYGFNACSYLDDSNSVTFEYDYTHPLYMPLFHL